jgi:hypothetical protein
MDEQVIRSLIKWPDVPDCYGWLALDRRGQWRMRDEFTQQNNLPGQVIKHQSLNEFISRNYACDSSGQYFFQNGPQRVFITLDATPFVARIIPSESGHQLLTQCGTEIIPQGALSDEKGNIYITGLITQSLSEQIDDAVFTKTESLTVALLHDHDLDLFSEQSQVQEDACSFRGSWLWDGKDLPIEPIHSTALSKRFHFVKVPSN